MSHVRGRVLPVALAAVVLVGGANLAAYAANGHPLLLGGSNSETKTASVTNTGSGAALSLHTSKSSPPLAVNSSKVVKHLNADTVDGKQRRRPSPTNVFTYNVPGGTDPAVQPAAERPAQGQLPRHVSAWSCTPPATLALLRSDDDTGIPTDLLGYGANRRGFSTSST